MNLMSNIGKPPDTQNSCIVKFHSCIYGNMLDNQDAVLVEDFCKGIISISELEKQLVLALLEQEKGCGREWDRIKMFY